MSFTSASSILLSLSLTAGIASSASAQGGTLVVLNKGAATASFVDVASGEMLGTVPVGVGPHEIVVSSDGRWAVSANYGQSTGGNTLSVLDIRSRSVVRTIDLGRYSRPHGIDFLPGDSLVAVTSESQSAVVLVRISDGSVVRTLSTNSEGSHMLALVGDGSRIYTSNLRDDTVVEIDVASGNLERVFDVPAQPEAIGVTPSGSEVWVGSNGEGSVTVIDLASGEVRGTLEGFAFPYRILFTPDERLAILPDLRGNELRFVDRATLQELGRLELPGGGPQGVILSGDSQTLYQSLNNQGQVVAIDLTTFQVVRRYDVGPTPDGIGWAP
jgi:DNA-binding beta-propeller fold protein YncE